MKAVTHRTSQNPMVLFAASVSLCLAVTDHLAALDNPIVPMAERMLVQPVLDVPLRAPSVCKGPDGTFYLTGTSAVTQPDGTLDFENCTAIRLWKSKDCKTWEEIGEVFDPMKVGWTPDKGAITNWLVGPRGLPGVADSLRHYLGVTSPEIHYTAKGPAAKH